MIFGNRHVNNDIKICTDREEIEKVYVIKTFRGLHRLSIKLEKTY